MMLNALTRVKGQTFNQDPVSLVQPCRKGETWYEAKGYYKVDWRVAHLNKYLGCLAFP